MLKKTRERNRLHKSMIWQLKIKSSNGILYIPGKPGQYYDVNLKRLITLFPFEEEDVILGLFTR